MTMQVSRVGKYAVLVEAYEQISNDGTPVDVNFVVPHNLNAPFILVNYFQDYIAENVGYYGGKELTALNNNELKITFKNVFAPGGTSTNPVTLKVILQAIIYIPHSIQFF